MPGKFTDSLIGENLKVATEYFKAMVADPKNKNSGGSIGFIPFKITFTMDGLSGIKIYNSITVDTSFMPIGYCDTLRFIVTGVDHKLNQGDWETTLNTTFIPKTGKIDKIIGNLTFEVQKEAVVAPVKRVDPDNNNTNGPLTPTQFNKTFLWVYFTHQQGADGATQLYKTAYKNGNFKSNVPASSIEGNWPGGKTSSSGVKASNVTALYRTDQKKLALAFIDVWTQKMNEVVDKLNKLTGNNRTGYSYAAIKSIFDQVSDATIPSDALYQFAFFENGLNMDTDSPVYKGMFQIKNQYYQSFNDKWKEGPGHKAGYVKYGQSNFLAYMTELFPRMSKNYRNFVASSGYPN